MKNILLIPFLLIVNSLIAQKTIVRKLPLTASNINLLDAVAYLGSLNNNLNK